MDWTMAGHYPRRRLPAGTTLFHEGDLGASMYLVVEGSLQVSKRVIEGAERVLSTLGAGQYVGEMSLLTGAKRSATVRTVEASEVIEIDQPTFIDLLRRCNAVGTRSSTGATGSATPAARQPTHALRGHRLLC